MVPDKYKSDFSEERWAELCQLVETKGMRITWRDFTVSEMEVILRESGLSENQEKGARMYYIKKIKMNQIAIKLGYSFSTIKYYKKRVSKQLRSTCCKIFK